MMKDVTTTSVAWKTAKNDAATVSLKSTWKPTFQWKQDTLVLKAVPHQDVHARDAANKVQPLSTVGSHVDFAQKFGLLTKDKNDKYQLGPNLDYALPTPIIIPRFLREPIKDIGGSENTFWGLNHTI